MNMQQKLVTGADNMVQKLTDSLKLLSLSHRVWASASVNLVQLLTLSNWYSEWLPKSLLKSSQRLLA